MADLAQAVTGVQSTPWGEILGGVGTAIGAVLAGVMVKGRYYPKKGRDVDPAKIVYKDVCLAKHEALEKRMETMQRSIDNNFGRVIDLLEKK